MMQLIKNELIKLRAQKSYIVLSCLVLTIVILMSFATSVLWTPLNMFIEYGEDMLKESAAYDWALKTVYEKPDSWQAKLLGKIFDNPRSDGDVARENAQSSLENGSVGYYEYFMAWARMYDFRDQNDLPEWIERAMSGRLFELYCWENVANGVLEGKYTPGDMAKEYYIMMVLEPSFTSFPYSLEIYDYDYKTDTYLCRFVIYGGPEGEAEEISYEQVLADIRDSLPLCKQAIAEAEKMALELEPDAYYDSLIAQLAAQELEYLASIEELEKQLEDDSQYISDWEIQYLRENIDYYRRQIETGKTISEAYAYLKEKGAHPESNSFAIVQGVYATTLSQINQVKSNITSAEQSMEETPLLSRAQRSSNKNKLRVLEKALVAVEYAYKNDVALVSPANGSSSGEMFVKNLSAASFLVSVVTVVLASMILSREFATGTIRLWVIRPRTRTKLLLSKIATLFIYIVSMMLICFGITYVLALVNHLLDLFFIGESTMFAPTYGVVFGQVVRIPAVLEHVWALVVLTLPILLYAMFCLLVSVVTKKGVLSIVLGMMVVMFAADIQAGALAVANYTGVLGYAVQATVLPYLNMEALLGSSLDYAVNSASLGSGGLWMLFNLRAELMGQIYGAMPYICSSLVGVIVLIAHTAFLILCNLLWFKRMQIKS